MTDRTASVQAFYSRWARFYDLNALLPGVESWRERAVEHLSLAPGDTVVEMGCGTGMNPPYLREYVGRRGTVIGVGFSREMLNQVATRIERGSWENISLIHADVT